ncbi:hypothetical protein AB0940_19400 [Streptomyces sp. NPDC006656]|uniref:hypothetical protein n=1 Tax=unclassified Streptomyces TaxID=2593676 RepID=UPI0033CD1B68
MSRRVAEVRAGGIEEALGAALGDAAAGHLAEGRDALELLGRHLSPQAPARMRS